MLCSLKKAKSAALRSPAAARGGGECGPRLDAHAWAALHSAGAPRASRARGMLGAECASPGAPSGHGGLRSAAVKGAA